MKKKNIVFIILFSILIIIISGVVVLNILMQYGKERSFSGSIDVYYYSDTSMDRIVNISNQENLTIIFIKNVTFNVESYIIVRYDVNDVDTAEKVKSRLDKYVEIFEIEIYDDI